MVTFLSITLLFYCQPIICLMTCKLVNMTSLMRLANIPISDLHKRFVLESCQQLSLMTIFSVILSNNSHRGKNNTVFVLYEWYYKH